MTIRFPCEAGIVLPATGDSRYAPSAPLRASWNSLTSSKWFVVVSITTLPEQPPSTSPPLPLAPDHAPHRRAIGQVKEHDGYLRYKRRRAIDHLGAQAISLLPGPILHDQLNPLRNQPPRNRPTQVPEAYETGSHPRSPSKDR